MSEGADERLFTIAEDPINQAVDNIGGAGRRTPAEACKKLSELFLVHGFTMGDPRMRPTRLAGSERGGIGAKLSRINEMGGLKIILLKL